MFSNCYSLLSLDLESFNIEKVTAMSYMFSNCRSLLSLNINNFNASSVSSNKVNQIFNNCKSLKFLNFTYYNISNNNQIIIKMIDGINKNLIYCLNLSQNNIKNDFYNCSDLYQSNSIYMDMNIIIHVINMYLMDII